MIDETPGNGMIVAEAIVMKAGFGVEVLALETQWAFDLFDLVGDDGTVHPVGGAPGDGAVRVGEGVGCVDLHFKNAKGIDISTAPPAPGIVSGAPSLEQQNKAHDVNIHSDNLIPMTDDIRMDIHMVMDGLLQCDDKLLLKQLISQREDRDADATPQIPSTHRKNDDQSSLSHPS